MASWQGERSGGPAFEGAEEVGCHENASAETSVLSATCLLLPATGNMKDFSMTILKTLAVGTFLASTLLAGTAFAKGHSQGVKSTTSETPGTDVGSETVANSVNEGATQRNENAPEKDMREPQGMSGMAGR
jgi:hypothetical protein